MLLLISRIALDPLLYWRRVVRFPRLGAGIATWTALVGLFVFSAFWGSHSFGIQDNNEGLYAEVSREMVATGDWVVPHLNGGSYLEKPPLLYWTTASLMQAFGPEDWIVRLTPVLFFGGMLAGVLVLARRIGNNRAAQRAVILLCSALGIVVMGRSMLFDVPLMCFLTWAFVFLLDWIARGRRSAIVGFYVFLALGVLTKGLVMLVLGGGIGLIATIRMRGDWRGVARLFNPLGLGVFFMIAAPWHVLAAMREPGFAHFYFINEHVLRFLDLRIPRDYYTGPCYYYLVRMPLYLGLWIFALPLLRKPPGPRGDADEPDRAGRILLSSWFWFTFLFFSMSRAKANYYLLSAMPSLAILLGLAWPDNGPRSRRLLTSSAIVAVFGMLLLAAPHLLTIRGTSAQEFLKADSSLLAAVAASVVAAGGFACFYAWRGRNDEAFLATAGAGLCLLGLFPSLVRFSEGSLSQKPLVRYIQSHSPGSVVFYRDYEKLSSLAFYLRRPVPVLDSVSNDLFYTQTHHRGARFLDDGEFRALAERGLVCLVVRAERADEARLKFPDLRLKEVARSRSGVVLEVERGDPILITTNEVRSHLTR